MITSSLAVRQARFFECPSFYFYASQDYDRLTRKADVNGYEHRQAFVTTPVMADRGFNVLRALCVSRGSIEHLDFNLLRDVERSTAIDAKILRCGGDRFVAK